MKPSALLIFVCPSCHGALEAHAAAEDSREIITGTLACLGCSATYPIRDGVPRFVGAGSYASSFGRQWNFFRTVQLDSQNHSRISHDTFAETTNWTADDLRDQLVLDAGVGAGRFAECAADLGATVVGVDLTNAVDAASRNLGHLPNVHLAQADIFALPFRPATFDRAYSIGVLHHTPDPAKAFTCVASVVKPAGELAIYVYSRHGSGHRSSDLWRRVTTKLPAPVMFALSTAAIPLHYVYAVPGLGRVCRWVLPISPHRDWRWRWLDTFDWYTPTYQFKYLYPEIFRWFQNAGFSEVSVGDEPIRMRGIKREVAHG
jgi:SAM-dependent methyltransferase